MKVAVVGVTGLVGQVMLKVLDEYNFPITELFPVASKSSVGKDITYREKEYKVISLEKAVDAKPDLALFSAGSSVAKVWASKFAAVGCRVVDNSSAFRMEKDKKLIIPEINGNNLTEKDYIIANPN